MKVITAKWFECIVNYLRTTEEGYKKLVSETYTVNAETFTEAEARITEEMLPFIDDQVGRFQIRNINPAQYKEIIFSEETKDDRWFKVKVAFTDIDEHSNKKEIKMTYLVQADKTETAQSHTNEVMRQGMLGYRIVSNIETKIMDVFMNK